MVEQLLFDSLDRFESERFTCLQVALLALRALISRTLRCDFDTDGEQSRISINEFEGEEFEVEPRSLDDWHEFACLARLDRCWPCRLRSSRQSIDSNRSEGWLCSPARQSWLWPQ